MTKAGGTTDATPAATEDDVKQTMSAYPDTTCTINGARYRIASGWTIESRPNGWLVWDYRSDALAPPAMSLPQAIETGIVRSAEDE